MDACDYLVVGAGSAGCIVASRLSEDGSASVLLLEAGGEDDAPAIADPRAFATLIKSPFDWGYTTEPEPALQGRSIAWPRGKCLGGTSAINAMVFIRGNRLDYDGWAATGNVGWSYDELLPYFIKSEANGRGASRFHGADGPLAVTDPDAPHPYSRAFVEAAVQLGHPRNPDFNGASQWGAGLYQRTIGGGTRCSAARAFIHPARRRANLRVLTDTQATRIVFEGRRAVGVRCRRGGSDELLTARREVLLCAGAIDSPKLLLLSGIGPPDRLAGLGIPVVAERPGVGRNLQDHPLARIRYWTRSHHDVDASSNQVEAGFFCDPPDSAGTAGAPRLSIHFVPVATTEQRDGALRSAFGIASVVLRPESRGSVDLRSADPADPPLVRAGYYCAPADLDLMVQGLEIARALVRTPALRDIVVEEALPGSAVVGANAMADYVRATGDTCFHPVGSCRMGVDGDAVVDPHLRVRGVTSLRVIDASIMPTIVSGNTNAAVMAIAEKGADLVMAQ